MTQIIIGAEIDSHPLWQLRDASPIATTEDCHLSEIFPKLTIIKGFHEQKIVDFEKYPW